jgi:predicted O-linked N-acetylglucosamine transferase (SPINDLY family)
MQNDISRLFHEAVTHFQHGRHSEAEESLRMILDDNSEQVDANHLLGVIAGIRGDYDLAETLISKAISHGPPQALCHFNLGLAMYGGGRLGKALAAFDQAILLEPDQADFHNRRGIVLQEMGRLDESLAALDQAIRLQPGLAGAHNNRGITLRKLDRLEEARCSYTRALELSPDYIKAYTNRGHVFKELGYPEEAEHDYRKALELQPTYAAAHSNLVFLLAAGAKLSPDEMLGEMRYWDEVQGEAGRSNPLPARAIDTTPGRKLRIGYVSPDLRMHSVSYFFAPLLAAHDRDRFEIYCYAARKSALSDFVTERLRVLADHWRFVYELSEEALARQIREDRIDILVDLAGHTGGNRLQAFSWRPAPVQVTWLGFFNGTGLRAMDYWITDEVLHPVDTPEKSVEEIFRLPRCWVCYEPPVQAPPVAPCPNRDERVMFGSFSNLSKLTPEVIETWSRLLQALPISQLLLMDKTLGEAMTRERILGQFERHGISSLRLVMVPGATFEKYLSSYARVDIVLDPFPRTGGTTTAEALWMGVPVVTLAGERYVERISASKLVAVDLEDMITGSRDEYIETAVSLANDPEKRSELRDSLRGRMAQSPLCDATGHARAMEAAYTTIWEDYLAGIRPQ